MFGTREDQFRFRVVEFVAVAALYALVAKGSLAFASINPSATPIWPPTGLALGLTLLRGQRILPAIFLGALAANAVTAGTIASSAAIALGNMLEALVGAYLMNRWAQGCDAFQTPSGIAKFALIVAAASTPISATIGVAALGAAGAAAWSNFPAIWATWWLGDAAGAVMVAPALVLWAESLRSRESAQKLPVEAILVLLFATAVGVVAFSPLLPSTGSRNALAFLAVLPLLWAALRRGPRDTATAALILSTFAVWGAASGEGPFVQPTLNASLLLLISFIASVTLPSLALSSAMSSRDRALEKTEEDYHRLIDSVRDYAIIMLDPGGHVATWNASAARIKQYAQGEILGRHFSCFYTEEDRQQDAPARALASAAESGKSETEGWRVRRDGSQFWANIAISAIRDDRGKLIGFAKVTRDVTDAHEAQAALEQTRKELHQAQKLEALGRFTGGVAHDFNNLLMAISGALRMLEQRPEPEQLDKVLEEMRYALERGTDLTRQLLAFARRDTLHPETVDIAERIQSMRGILDRSLGPDIGLELSFPADLWAISVDPSQLELVILNLAMNARDAMPGGGVLTITAKNTSTTEGDFVEISARDNGMGMTPDVLSQAFEPFFSTKEPGRGTGLGLSQVHGFAVQSGGSARIESEIARGTVVTLSLPRSQNELSSSAAPSRGAGMV